MNNQKQCSNPNIVILSPCAHTIAKGLQLGQFFQLARGHTPAVVLKVGCNRVGYRYVHRSLELDRPEQDYLQWINVNAEVIPLTLEKATFRQERL